MKVTLHRTSEVTNGSLVQINNSNVAEPLAGGALSGVATNCRTVEIQETPESPVETVAVCEVVLEGACQALLSGSAPAEGGYIYADGARVSLTASGQRIGRLIPRGWSSVTPYVDGELVTCFICGV